MSEIGRPTNLGNFNNSYLFRIKSVMDTCTSKRVLGANQARRIGRTADGTGGFSLLELLVITIIIAAVAGLILGGISIVQTKSLTTKCASRARSIGVAVKSYVSSWNGMANPFGYGGYFPALFGHPLADPAQQLRQSDFYGSTQSFDYVNADLVLDYRCPLDATPGDMLTGYRSSYQLSSTYVSGNSINSASNSILLHEPGTVSTALPTAPYTVRQVSNPGRHPNSLGVKTPLYLFSDLHFEIPGGGSGGDTQFLPGLLTSVYSTSTWPSPAGSPPSSDPFLELVWSENMVRDSRNPVLSAASEVTNILLLFVGYLEFPRDGKWKIYVDCKGQQGLMAVDANSDGGDPLDDTVIQSRVPNNEQRNDEQSTIAAINPTSSEKAAGSRVLKRRVVFTFLRYNVPNYHDYHFRFSWENRSAGVAKTIIPASRLFHTAQATSAN